jgi:hypothetical protein
MEACRADVEIGHRFCGGFELGADALFCTATFAHIAIDAPVQADLIGRVDVDTEVVEGAQSRIVKGEDALDQKDLRRCDGLGSVRHAGVRGEVVDGTLDAATLGQSFDMFDQKGVFERIRVIEVLERALVCWKVAETAIVEVQRQQRGRELRRQFAGKGGLA